MKKELLKNILIVLLVALTSFSIFKYVSSLKERYSLLNTLGQIKEQVATLENEKQNLLQEIGKEKELQQKLTRQNSGLKDYLKASRKRLTRLFSAHRKAQNEIEELDAKFSILKTENRVLVEEKQRYATENEGLKAKLSSIAELKKAISELKRQMRKVPTVKKAQMQNEEKNAEGNRGYIIKDGKLTYPAKVRIEVIPATTTKE
jgi:chromosome segregation ATPase